MVTKQQAMTANNFHFGTCGKTVGPKGGVTFSIEQWRRNGATQIWKRSPDRFRVPVKHGLRGYGSITENNAELFHASEDCPLYIGGETWVR